LQIQFTIQTNLNGHQYGPAFDRGAINDQTTI
jgi:hypothetical protein